MKQQNTMLRVILHTIFCAVLFVGCEKEVNDERLRVSLSNIEIGCEGGTVQVDIESTSDWKVFVESNCTWVKSDRYESEVDRRQWIKLTISKNNTENTRNTTITIRNSDQSRDITITQTPISLNVSPESIDAGQEKTTKDISINSNISWSAKSSDSWITLSKSSGTAGTTTLNVNIEANTLASSRTGQITVYNQDYNITKKIVVNQAASTISVSTNSIEVGPESSTQNVNITSNIPWTAKTSDSWITLSKSTGYAGTTILTINIGANTLASSRSGYVEISNSEYNISRRINIQQNGYTPTEYCIEYTSTSQITIDSSAYFGALIESHTWNNGNGVIRFDGPVTSIGEYAFYNCRSLTSITIPESVTSIERCAFWGCSSLTSITIGNGVTSIGEVAFSGCRSLTSITIPNSVTSIGDSAFAECTSLTSINIPNSVTSIGYSAFYSCSSLTSINIPNSVTYIGYSAFWGCRSLTSITIPESVTSIEEAAFACCSNLKSVKGKYASSDGRCLIIDGKLIAFAPAGLTSYTIPNSVTSIGTYAFCDCSSLTSINIPESVTNIRGCAFYGCSSLTSITIPQSVTSIENWTFEGCSSLTSITIPESVTSIGDYAFNYCSSLKSITIPNSVTSIGNYAFHSCRSLTSITIPERVTSIGDYAFYTCIRLTSVYCKATTPPAGTSVMFDGNASGRIIYVPRNSVSAYKSADGWSAYAANIVGYDF